MKADAVNLLTYPTQEDSKLKSEQHPQRIPRTQRFTGIAKKVLKNCRLQERYEILKKALIIGQTET
jgi:hypothetical protein